MQETDENAKIAEKAQALLRDVRFENYQFSVVTSRGIVYLSAEYMEADVYSGINAMQRTRKWLLSPHMTDSEIVATAFKCCITSMEHRAREGFTYKGARIFGPHFDVEDLVRLCQSGRENSGGRTA